MASTFEIDPVLKRGIKLLHSRSRDSADMLKAMLDDIIRQRQGKAMAAATGKETFGVRRESPVPRNKQGSPAPMALGKRDEHKKETRKYSADKDTIELPHKRPRLDSPSNIALKSHTPSPTPSSKSSEGSSRSRKSDESDSDAEMNNLEMEITDGIACCVCMSINVSTRNQLLECQECHSLYHQECHTPHVSTQDATDPRLVWYCAKCTRSLKKQTTGGVGHSKLSSGKGSSFGVSGAPSPSKSSLNTRQTPFANLTTAKSFSSTSTPSASSGGGKVPPTSAANAMLSAEKRVQLMKKKAAAKAAEKRKM